MYISNSPGATFEVKDFTYPDEPTVVWSLIKAKINL